MPTQIYTCPEAHAAAIQSTRMRMDLLTKPCPPWTMTSLDLNNFKAQWGNVGGGTFSEGATVPGSVVIFMPTQNFQVMRMNGHRFDGQTFRLQMPGEEFCLSSSVWHGWFALSIPNEVFAEWSDIGAMVAAPTSHFIRVPRECAEVLRRNVAQLGSRYEYRSTPDGQ